MPKQLADDWQAERARRRRSDAKEWRKIVQPHTIKCRRARLPRSHGLCKSYLGAPALAPTMMCGLPSMRGSDGLNSLGGRRLDKSASCPVFESARKIRRVQIDLFPFARLELREDVHP